MSDQSSQEPTMEEILASIRRIISEDDAPGGAPAEAAAEPEVAAAEEPIPIPPAEEEPLEDDGALELTERVESHGDLDVYASEPEPVYEAPAADVGEGLVGDPAAAAAAAHFGQLSSTILMPADGRTLEDVVRELLRPLLKGWLDEHLPNIVQTAVQAEVERIARGRVR
jgi:cell pole-organizing protein PopZ